MRSTRSEEKSRSTSSNSILVTMPCTVLTTTTTSSSCGRGYRPVAAEGSGRSKQALGIAADARRHSASKVPACTCKNETPDKGATPEARIPSDGR
jgi:hypothetical protein